MRRTPLFLVLSSLALLGAGCAPAAPEPPPPGGIYRSEDGGISFRQLVRLSARPGETLPHLARVTPRAVADSPRAPGVLYLAAAEGFFRTTNAGETWERLSLRARDLFSVSVHPTNPDILLAAGTARFPAGRGKIFKSLTGGASWAEVYAAPAATREVGSVFPRRQEAATLITVVAHDPLRPNVVLAATNTGTLLESDDGGVRWRTLYAFRQGITGLELSPSTPGLAFLRLTDGQIARLAPGSTTADPVALPRRDAAGLQRTVEAAQTILFAMRSTVTDRPPILLGTDAGLYRSLDDGQTWETLPLPPTGGIADTPVGSLAESPDGTLWAASGFVLFSSKDGGGSWKATQSELAQSIRFVVADPSNPQRLFLFFSATP